MELITLNNLLSLMSRQEHITYSDLFISLVDRRI